MRKIKNYVIRKESVTDMLDAGRFNPSLEIQYKDRYGKYTKKLSSGYSDDISVYRQEDDTYVLSTNFRLGYVGLEVFNKDSEESIFLEEYQANEVFGRDDWNEMMPQEIIRTLIEYL